MNIRNVSNNIFKYENTVKIVIGVCLFVCLCGFDRRSSVIFYVIISILTVCAMMAINLRKIGRASCRERVYVLV